MSRTPLTKKQLKRTYEGRRIKYLDFDDLKDAVYVARSTIQGAGFGLFARRDLNKKKDLKNLSFKSTVRLTGAESKDVDSPYLIKLSKDNIIDETHDRSMASFVNHFPEKKNLKLKNSGRYELIKNVKKDDELFTAYGLRHYKHLKNTNQSRRPTCKVVLSETGARINPRGCKVRHD